MFLFYTNPILIAAAVLPAIFLLVHVYRADKLEKEPAPLLISLVLYGMPGHACFGVFMGVWYGLAKRLHGQGRDSASKLCRVLALLLPALLHGCYDFIASIESVHYGWLFAAFVAILFVLAFILVRRQARHDRYINNYDAEYL